MTVEDSPAFLTRASPSFSAGFPGLLGSYHPGAGSPGVAGPRRFYPRYASRLVHLPRRESLRHPWRQASQVRQRPHARWARGAEDRQLKRGIRPDLLLSGLQPACVHGRLPGPLGCGGSQRHDQRTRVEHQAKLVPRCDRGQDDPAGRSTPHVQASRFDRDRGERQSCDLRVAAGGGGGTYHEGR